MVSIYQSLADDSQRTWLKAPKTDRSVRDIVIAGPIVDELRAMKAEAAGVAKALRADVGSMPVFPNTRGNMMDPGDLSDTVRQILANAELKGFRCTPPGTPTPARCCATATTSPP